MSDNPTIDIAIVAMNINNSLMVIADIVFIFFAYFRCELIPGS